MTELPGLPVAAATGFRLNRVIAAILETGTTGNRIVISYDPGTSKAYILFYTGLAGEVPGQIESQLTGGTPDLIIRSGATAGGAVAQLSLNGGGPLSVASLSADRVLMLLDRWNVTDTSSPAGQGSGIIEYPATSIPVSAVVVAGAVRTIEPWKREAGEQNAVTDGLGDFTVGWAVPLSGVGAVFVQVQGTAGAGPAVVERQAVGVAAATYRAYNLAGAVIAGTALTFTYEVIGW